MSSTTSTKSDNSGESAYTGESNSNSHRSKCQSQNQSQSQSQTGRRGELIGGYSSSAISCVQTVLSFKRYLALLEDLWRRRPCDQFKELATRTSNASVPSSSPSSKHSKRYCPCLAPAVESSCESSSRSTKSVLFIPAGAPSLFSADKCRDIALAIEAAHLTTKPSGDPELGYGPGPGPICDRTAQESASGGDSAREKETEEEEEEEKETEEEEEVDVSLALSSGLLSATLSDNHGDRGTLAAAFLTPSPCALFSPSMLCLVRCKYCQ